MNGRLLLSLCCALLLAGCVTGRKQTAPEPTQLSGWIDIERPVLQPVRVTVTILAHVDGQLLPLQKSNYRVSNLPLKYDFRRLPKSTNSAGLFIRAELRWADSPGLQARYQKRITVAPEKIVLIPMPCFPGCR